jgi:hypothetical protein
LSNTEHCWIQDTILSCHCVRNIEECHVVLLNATLGSLQTLVRWSCFLLKHLIQLLLRHWCKVLVLRCCRSNRICYAICWSLSHRFWALKTILVTSRCLVQLWSILRRISSARVLYMIPSWGCSYDCIWCCKLRAISIIWIEICLWYCWWALTSWIMKHLIISL